VKLQPEEAILYAKLNLNNYMKHFTQNYPLKLETLYATLGFCYYLMAKHAIYNNDRNVYILKTIEYFDMSFKY
jgi:hypothetical protein